MNVFGRTINKPPPVVSHAEGVYIYDKTGKQYLDGSGGAAVSCLGHGDEDVNDAIKEQLAKVAFAHTGFFDSEPAQELAKRLADNAPDGLNKVYFVSGGSEAMEAALKLARQYWLEKGQPKKTKFIARQQSYHGNTLGALATGGNKNRRKPYEPIMTKAEHIPPCYAYRHQGDNETEEEYSDRTAECLRTTIKKVGAENVIAFVAEPVVGATLGAVPATKGYFERIRKICDEFDVLLILDEVMCGMGRTGTFFACEQDGISPDIAVIAKGLGAGYQPIGAMMCSTEVFGAIKDGSGSFAHGHTYMGHPTACAAANVVTKKLVGGLAKKSEEMGKVLMDALKQQFAQHPHIGDVRGRGMFVGLEIVRDRETKKPFGVAKNVPARVKEEALKTGLMCYPMGGTVDGKNGAHILVAPPFIFTPNHVDELVQKLDKAIRKAL